MARSQNSFIKKEKEKKRQQKRKEKQQRKEDRKANSQTGGSLEDMMAYVDSDGNILDHPPEEAKQEVDAGSIDVSTPKKAEDETAGADRQGRVAFFDAKKGYGFINQHGSQERFFVHSSSLTSVISEGDKVSFTSRKGLKGMEAVNVKLI